MLIAAQEMTPEGYLDYAEQHPDTHFDFIDGELVEALQKPIQGRLQAQLAYILSSYLDSAALGSTYIEALHVLEGRKFQPDVSINTPTDADYFTTPPLVAVEIRSDTQSREAQRRKARDYIAHGTPLVLLVMPQESVEVFQPGQDPIVLRAGDTLTGYDVLPGFALPLNRLFPD